MITGSFANLVDYPGYFDLGKYLWEQPLLARVKVYATNK